MFITPPDVTMQTDSNGNFIFTPDPMVLSLSYDVTFSKTGYGSRTLYDIAMPSNTKLTIGLAPSGGLQITKPWLLLPGATGTAYRDVITISGGVGPYSFSLANGTTLPSGLTLDPQWGVISGSPTTAGTYSFDVGVVDTIGFVAESSFSISITAPLAISTASPLPRGTVGTAYSQTVLATGGTAPYSFSASGLPNGLSINTTSGGISGSPAAAGQSTVTVTVTDSDDRTTSKQLVLTVDAPLAIDTATLNAATVGGALPPYSWGISSGSLPPGLVLGADGQISGTPLASGGALATITVTDAYSRTQNRIFTLDVAPAAGTTTVKPLAILTAAIPNARVGSPYSESIRVSGGTAPYSFSLGSTVLPSGLSLNSDTGVISGTSTANQLVTITVTVTDSSQTPVTVSKNLTVRSNVYVTIITPAVLATIRTEQAMTPVTLAGAGGSLPYTWAVVGGALPEGVSLDPAKGQISGTPTETGDFSFTVRLTDNLGATTAASGTNLDKPFFIKVTGPMTVTTTTLPDGGVGIPYRATVTASGGLPPYSWSGSLPAGLTLAANGSISGTPSDAGSADYTLTVTDSDSPARSLQQVYSLKVANQLDIVETALPDATRNQAYSAIIRSQFGKPPFSWRLVSSSLPAPLTLVSNNSYATISGTPDTAGGPYTVNLAVTDSASPALEVIRSFTFSIAQDLQITTTGLSGAVSGVPYSATVAVAGGNPPYRFDVSTGVLPEGLGIDPDTGVISGIPTLASGESATFTLRVTDSGSPAATVDKEFVITGMNLLSITTATVPSATQKTPYSTTLAGSGGVGAYTWTIAAGTLPTGVTLAATTGVLAGTPALCGSFPISVRLTDSAPAPTVVQKAFTLAVACANYSISGNAGVGGATVALSGGATATATSASDGSYSFGSLVNGNYTITPTKTGYSFSPASRAVTVSNLDLVVAAFTVQDISGPTITVFGLPASSPTMNVAVTITAGDNTAVAGYYLSENGTTPLVSAAGWSMVKPASFAFSARGPRTLYLWVKDAVGNISARSTATTTIDYQLTVTLAGTGGGSINSSPVGISTTSGSTSATYAPNTQVLLTQIVDSTSFFNGWSGACTATTGSCTVTMTGDKSATATYAAADRARIVGGIGYSSLNAAYAVAASGATINLLDAVLVENLIITKSVTLVGGYNIRFDGRNVDPTVLDGTLTIRSGTLVVDGLAIQ